MKFESKWMYKNKSAAFTSVVIKQALMCKESADRYTLVSVTDSLILVMLVFV